MRRGALVAQGGALSNHSGSYCRALRVVDVLSYSWSGGAFQRCCHRLTGRVLCADATTTTARRFLRASPKRTSFEAGPRQSIAISS
jgi:hypothetical protein